MFIPDVPKFLSPDSNTMIWIHSTDLPTYPIFLQYATTTALSPISVVVCASTVFTIAPAMMYGFTTLAPGIVLVSCYSNPDVAPGDPVSSNAL